MSYRVSLKIVDSSTGTVEVDDQLLGNNTFISNMFYLKHNLLGEGIMDEEGLFEETEVDLGDLILWFKDIHENHLFTDLYEYSWEHLCSSMFKDMPSWTIIGNYSIFMNILHNYMFVPNKCKFFIRAC